MILRLLARFGPLLLWWHKRPGICHVAIPIEPLTTKQLALSQPEKSPNALLSSIGQVHTHRIVCCVLAE